MMEKRFRDFLKHFEKLDYDVLSEEEISDERGNLDLKTGILHREMLRLLVIIIGFVICACIFLSQALISGNLFCYILSATFAVVAAVVSFQYRAIGAMIRQLEAFADKLTML